MVFGDLGQCGALAQQLVEKVPKRDLECAIILHQLMEEQHARDLVLNFKLAMHRLALLVSNIMDIID